MKKNNYFFTDATVCISHKLLFWLFGYVLVVFNILIFISFIFCFYDGNSSCSKRLNYSASLSNNFDPKRTG